jgi:hypothetical protein
VDEVNEMDGAVSAAADAVDHVELGLKAKK